MQHQQQQHGDVPPADEWGLNPVFWSRPKLLVATLQSLGLAGGINHVLALPGGQPVMGAQLVGTIVSVLHKAGFSECCLLLLADCLWESRCVMCVCVCVLPPSLAQSAAAGLQLLLLLLRI
jgi:hypothetical protein